MYIMINNKATGKPLQSIPTEFIQRVYTATQNHKIIVFSDNLNEENKKFVAQRLDVGVSSLRNAYSTSYVAEELIRTLNEVYAELYSWESDAHDNVYCVEVPSIQIPVNEEVEKWSYAIDVNLHHYLGLFFTQVYNRVKPHGYPVTIDQAIASISSNTSDTTYDSDPDSYKEDVYDLEEYE